MKKVLAFLLCLAMVIGFAPSQAFASGSQSVSDALDNIIQKQYATGSAIDWYGAAALYTKLGNGAYGYTDLDAYQLADYSQLGSNTACLYMAMIKGDKDAAVRYANAQVSGGEMSTVGYYSSDAMALISLMGFNRGMPPADQVAFNTGAAIRLILFKPDANDQTTFSSNYAYDWNNVAYDDPDTLAGAYAAVSMAEFNGFALEDTETYVMQDGTNKTGATIDEIRADMFTKLATFQDADGLFNYGNVWTTAWACFGVNANGTSDSLTKDPARAMATSTSYSEADGAMLGTDWNTGATIVDISATNQAALAFAEDATGSSFFKNVSFNYHEYNYQQPAPAPSPSSGSDDGGSSAAPAVTTTAAITPAAITPTAVSSDELIAAAAEQYDDVDEDDWFAEAAGYCLRHGYMNGIRENAFGANETTNRGMIVTIIWRMAGSPEPTSPAAFKDVPADAYYAKAAAWANEAGIAKGRNGGIFDASAPITREEFFAFAQRYAEKYGLKAETQIGVDHVADRDSVSSWAADAAEWAIANGITDVSKGRLDPKSKAPRSQAAMIVMRLDKLPKAR